MKKLLLAAFIAVSLFTSAFATPVNNVSYFVTRSFNDRFPEVSNVEWTVSPSYVKATFILNNVRTEAFYKPDGDFIATCHSISLDDLPIVVKRSFAKKYGSYTVKEAIKFDGAEETAYFISAEDNNHSVVLKVADRDMSVYLVSDKK